MEYFKYDPAKLKLFPNLPRYEPILLDHTAYSTLVDCRRKYFLRMVLGRVDRTGNKNQIVLDFGSAYHKFREILETKGFKEAYAYVESVQLPRVDPNSKYVFLDKLRLLKSCGVALQHWQTEKKANKIQVIATEQPVNAELSNGHFISGRADQIVKWNGRLWGRDFKTTTKDEATFTKGIDPNDQAIRYIWLESQIHGQEIQGIIFEVLYNAKTVGPKIYSKLSTRTKYQIDQWKKEQELNFRLLDIYREEDTWPMDMYAQNCSWCPYHKVCRLGSPEAMENVLKSDYIVQPWNHLQVEQEAQG